MLPFRRLAACLRWAPLVGLAANLVWTFPAAGIDFPAAIAPLGPHATLGAPPAQLERALLRAAEAATWTPGAAPRPGSRGAGLDLYPTVAPAVVVVRTPMGHGSGFLIDADGWIITNHHVIATAATDMETGAPIADVNVGQMSDHLMHVLPEAVPAVVYRASAERDLALLKLVRKPAGMTQLPALALAKAEAVPGSECVAIGHPAAGLLWTMRQCDVDGIGDWPSEHIDVRMWTLRSTSQQDAQNIARLMAQIPKRRVVLSSCGINPGDSGGPLVNASGEVIAVTFAIPPSGLDHFSYHIDVSELKAFLADRPKTPDMQVPDAWPEASAWELHDYDHDGKMESLVFGLGNGSITGVLCDLDENTCPDSATVAAGHFNLDPAKWDFEFALQPEPEHRTFYDQDDDGKVDRVVIESAMDPAHRLAFELKGGTWARAEKPGNLLDPALVPAAVRGRYARVLQALLNGK